MLLNIAHKQGVFFYTFHWWKMVAEAPYCRPVNGIMKLTFEILMVGLGINYGDNFFYANIYT